jgi:hypothetical protein
LPFGTVRRANASQLGMVSWYAAGLQSVYGDQVLGVMKAISQRSVEDHDPVLRGQPVSQVSSDLPSEISKFGPRENAGHTVPGSL